MLALGVTWSWPAHAQVDLPVPVPLPQVELPPAPVPLPAPPPPPQPVVDLPLLPPVTPTAPQVSAPALPTVSQPRSVGVAVERSGLALPGQAGSGPGPAPWGGESEQARKRGSQGIHGSRYRKRGPLVRGLRGCLDRLRSMQRSALIVRYGIGGVESRSARRAARTLDVSRSRFRRLERRGVRSLVRAARRSSCERTGVSEATLDSVFRMILNASPGASFTFAALGGDSGLRLASASPQDEAGRGGVAGRQRSSEPGPEGSGQEDGGPSSAGPALATPFGDLQAAPDNPLFMLFLAVALAGIVFATRGIVRAVR